MKTPRLTKREFFAAMAMQGMAVAPNGTLSPPFMVVDYAVRYADFLIAELDKTPEVKPLVERALAALKDRHVQENKKHIGQLGVLNIDGAIEDLEQVLKPEREQKIL